MELNKSLVTPIQKLSIKLNNNSLFIKREDLIPVSFGGNKARKALLFFEDIKSKGANCVVTYGTSSSNHCRIISNIAASKQLPCYIISPIEASKSTSNSKMIELFGAKIVYCPKSDVSNTISTMIEELKVNGYTPYFIQGGGHGDLGTQAYVNVYTEIIDYEKKNGINFDYIFHASGTGTTQAGLVCGNILSDKNKRIVGISIARKNPFGKQVVLNSINSFFSSIGKKHLSIDTIDFIDDFVLDGYGSHNKDVINVIKQVLINDGIPMDTTYTGKAFWGMKQFIINNNITEKNILFIHTGGTPLFFDDLEALMNE